MKKTNENEIRNITDFITEFLPKKTNIVFSVINVWEGIDNYDGTVFYGMKFDVPNETTAQQVRMFYDNIFELVDFWEINQDKRKFLTISLKNRPLSEQKYYF